MKIQPKKYAFSVHSSRTFQEVARKHHPVGVSELVELPQGDVTEVRRGGPESLRLLSMDMARLGSTGYIRIERRPKEQMPRIGHIAFLDGKPMFALHEADAISMSLEALLDIENDASLLDALLAIHELSLPDATQVLSLYPEAHFRVEEESEQPLENHQWWSKTNMKSRSWRREERLPELEVVVEAPEAIRQRSKALMQRYDGIEKMMRPGDAYFLDSVDPAPLFDLAGNLAVHGRPLLVLARHDIEALNVEHNIPIASSSWLSQNGDQRSTDPALENIRRRIDAFLWENLRAVVVLEGVEYLASLHGDELVVNFLRDIVDGVRLEDHLFLATGDFHAFPLTTRQHLSRYMTDLEPAVLEHWNLEPDLILDHPLCAPASEEEIQWIKQQLQQAISSPSSEGIPPQSTVFGTMEGGHESLDSEDIIAATETLGTVAREWIRPTQNPSPPSHEVRETKPLAENVVSNDIPDSELQHEQQVDDPASRMNDGRETFENPASEAPPTSETGEKDSAIVPDTSTPQAITSPEKIIAPRPAQRVRRRKKNATAKSHPRHQQSLHAAAVLAVEAKELSEIQIDYSTPGSTFANSLATYAERQDLAVEKMRAHSSPHGDSSLNNASIQLKNIQDIEEAKVPLRKGSIESVKGRRPVNTETSLTPLNARPGASRSVSSNVPTRESASRKQSEPSLENKLSIWEREDRERLRKELEGAK